MNILILVIAFKLLLLLLTMWVVLMGVQGTTLMISTALDHSPLIYESGRRGEATNSNHKKFKMADWGFRKKGFS